MQRIKRGGPVFLGEHHGHDAPDVRGVDHEHAQGDKRQASPEPPGVGHHEADEEADCGEAVAAVGNADAGNARHRHAAAQGRGVVAQSREQGATHPGDVLREPRVQATVRQQPEVVNNVPDDIHGEDLHQEKEDGARRVGHDGARPERKPLIQRPRRPIYSRDPSRLPRAGPRTADGRQSPL